MKYVFGFILIAIGILSIILAILKIDFTFWIHAWFFVPKYTLNEKIFLNILFGVFSVLLGWYVISHFT